MPSRALFSMTSAMAIIQEWLAETSTARGASRRLLPVPVFLLALGLAMLGAARPARAQQIGNQGGTTLQLPPPPGHQTEVLPEAPPPPFSRQPNANVLVIPRASRDFVGEWGGHLRLTRVIGMPAPASHDSIVSLAFGETKGTVFMQTTAFASRSSQIVDTSADVINPRTIRVKLKGLEMAFQPPVIHKEELHLALTGKDNLNCLKYVDFYQPGNDVPIASLAYEGDLHVLSAEERRELTEQVLRRGQIPQKDIEGSRSFGP
jgi:hypothetical protein